MESARVASLIPRSVKRALVARAQAERRTLSDYIRRVLEDHLTATGFPYGKGDHHATGKEG